MHEGIESTTEAPALDTSRKLKSPMALSVCHEERETISPQTLKPILKLREVYYSADELSSANPQKTHQASQV